MGKPKRKAQSGPAAGAAKKAKTAGKPSAAAKGKGKGKAPTGANGKAGMELGPTGKPKRRPDQPKKVKLRDQKNIPVPKTDFASDDDDIDSDAEDILDMDLGEEEGLEVGNAGGFLASLDSKVLSRTAKENKRIHNLEKARDVMPVKAKKAPSIASLSDISDYDFDSEVDMSDDDLSDKDELDMADSDEGEDDEDEDDEDEDDEDEDDEDGENVDSDDQDVLNDEFDDLSDDEDADSEEEEDQPAKKKRKNKDEEADYELSGRTRWAKEDSEEEDDHMEVGRLPIKLPTGEVQLVAGTTRVAKPQDKKKPKPKPESDDEEEEESEEDASDVEGEAKRMAAQPGRFGRMGIADIVSARGWKNSQRLEAAKEMMATLGAEIMGGGELVDIGPMITRLSTFSLPTVRNPDPEGDSDSTVPVPFSIRGMALLSQLAVYKDIIPGYRIRQLTEKEEAEKVRDDVRRQREGEKVLVRNYKTYLKTLESEVKGKTALTTIALKCLCELLEAVPHFNYSENIMGVLVGRIGRRSWDADSDLILNSFVTVFRADLTGTYSQALVKLISRMIKERKFQVHANVLACLLHLRLRQELHAMHQGKRARGKGKGKDAGLPEKKYKSEVRKKWQTKAQKKREKEMKEVQKEMAEAEAEVDLEERSMIQTETLKNLFVLYFSILKHPGRSPLLPAALEGISHFAHLINIDFFRDLLQVLRKIIADQHDVDEEEDGLLDATGSAQRVRIRMLGIVTAFDLLSGQGEAINIDLADFVDELFALLRPLALDTGLEDPPIQTAATALAAAQQYKAGAQRASATHAPAHTLSTSALLFRCLDSIFFPRLFASTASAPPLRAAAFAKRMIECALLFPPATAAEAVEFVRKLANKEPRLANLLDTEERTFDGVYRPDMDDPALTNPFTTSLYETELLSRHWDNKVRVGAAKLRDAKFI